MHFSRRIERLREPALTYALAGILLGASPGPAQLDSQVVVNRYIAALDQASEPPFAVFSYRVSQAGAHNIEQTHRIFRGAVKERDETVSTEGDPVKIVRVISVDDRYAVTRIAPRVSAYAFLFLQTRRHGKHLDYIYATEPMVRSSFTITGVTIDGETYLPSLVTFKSVAGKVHADGSVAYGKAGPYWMPTVATATSDVAGHPTRERITWSGYSFPSSLPPSTFIQPKGLSVPTIPPPLLFP